jgi:hypothetical protein
VKPSLQLSRWHHSSTAPSRSEISCTCRDHQPPYRQCNLATSGPAKDILIKADPDRLRGSCGQCYEGRVHNKARRAPASSQATLQPFGRIPCLDVQSPYRSAASH